DAKHDQREQGEQQVRQPLGRQRPARSGPGLDAVTGPSPLLDEEELTDVRAAGHLAEAAGVEKEVADDRDDGAQVNGEDVGRPDTCDAGPDEPAGGADVEALADVMEVVGGEDVAGEHEKDV